jgi:hypothetical protein
MNVINPNDYETTGAGGVQSRTRAVRVPKLPNKIMRRWPLSVSMTPAEVEEWVASYNDWVALWNRHETSADLPLSPKWKAADWEYGPLFSSALPESCLVFVTNDDHRVGAIRVVGWQPHYANGSFCRNPVTLDRVTWAGWLQKYSPRVLVGFADELEPA